MKYLTLLVTALFVCSCLSAPPPQKSFSVNLKSPRNKTGETEGYLSGISSFGTMKKIPINVFYYPDDDAVCLQFKYEFTDCNQFWDRAGREAFVGALQTYEVEFEQRKLANSNRKNRNAYGTVPGFFAWKRTIVSQQLSATTDIGLGYQFRKKSVFFSTTQSEAVFQDPMASRTVETQREMIMYFTREQARALAVLFNQELLLGLEKSATGAMDSY